jgi:hypothetical protein
MTDETLPKEIININLEFSNTENLTVKDVKINDIEVENIQDKDDKNKFILKVKKLDVNFIFEDDREKEIQE